MRMKLQRLEASVAVAAAEGPLHGRSTRNAARQEASESEADARFAAVKLIDDASAALKESAPPFEISPLEVLQRTATTLPQELLVKPGSGTFEVRQVCFLCAAAKY